MRRFISVSAGLLSLAALLLGGCGVPSSAVTGIPSDTAEPLVPAFIGRPAVAKPVDGLAYEHPFMASPDQATIHTDSYNSDVHRNAGVLGNNSEVTTRLGPGHPFGGMCSTTTFDKDGYLVSLCASFLSFQLHLMDPNTLELLAVHYLPSRPTTFEMVVKADPGIAMTDTSGGAYHYMDNQDRIVLADSEQQITRIGHRKNAAGQWEFYEDGRWDMTDVVPDDCFNWNNLLPSGECDPISAVLPDAEGNIWWATRMGRFGALNPETGEKIASRFWAETKERADNKQGAAAGSEKQVEEIQNSFASDKDAVYIATDHALYALRVAADGKSIERLWKQTYDRGSEVKVGAINQGTGTTPTLLGDDYITLSDNADGLINLIVYRRGLDVDGEREICKVPLFDERGSATDNSMIGWGRSMIIENNAGYTNAFQMTDLAHTPGGVMRIDIREDESGCDVIWRSKERSLSVVPKLSAANGIVYLYGPDILEDGNNAWYLKGLDFETGETVFKIHTGVGQFFDNNWAPISIGPDGTTYVGSFKGIMAIRDRP